MYLIFSLGYILVALFMIYILSRIDYGEIAGFGVFWPILLIIAPLAWLGAKAYELGQKHRA
jgi:hypothetical protein